MYIVGFLDSCFKLLFSQLLPRIFIKLDLLIFCHPQERPSAMKLQHKILIDTIIPMSLIINQSNI